VLTIEGLDRDGRLHPSRRPSRASRLSVRLLHARHDPQRLCFVAEEARGGAGRNPAREWRITCGAAGRTRASWTPSRRRPRRCKEARDEAGIGTVAAAIFFCADGIPGCTSSSGVAPARPFPGAGEAPHAGRPSSDFNCYLRSGGTAGSPPLAGKVELGQGVTTSLAQMLAEELDVALDSRGHAAGRHDPT